MNILILSSGTRNKIVQYFKKTIGDNGMVICTDMSDLAPSLYEADKYYIVPKITASNYIDVILDICKKDNISGILSLIDPELSLLAKHQEKFKKIGTTVIGSSYELCEMSLNKFEMYKWLLKHGYKCAKSYMDKEEFYVDVEAGKISYPVFVKPARGSASIAISKACDKETVELLFKKNEDLMIQEFLDGQEIGADVYIDPISKKVVSIFTKEKIKMRAGETDKARSFKDKELFELISRLIEKIGYQYMIDMDIFKIDNDYYISEINPRFGGGYPHAYESGVKFTKFVINSINNVENQSHIGEYEENIYMMKYNEIMIKRG